MRCQVVPRLDYGQNDEIGPDGKVIKLKIKPLPALFSEQKARMYDPYKLRWEEFQTVLYIAVMSTTMGICIKILNYSSFKPKMLIPLLKSWTGSKIKMMKMG